MMSPSDLLATPVLNAFQNVALAIIIERQNKLNFSDQCQIKCLLPKTQNEFSDLLTIPSCTSWSSSTKTKVKDMENMLIFHVTLRIQILTVFSVQSKYSTRRRMARERRGAESSVVSMETRFLHTGSFTHRRFYTQTLLHTDAFYTQALLHTEAFTHRRFYTQTLLHTDAFTHRRFYTQTLFTHRLFYTQRLLHTEAFTRRDFYTQTLLHTDAFTHRRFYTNTFTRRDCYRQTL